MVEAAGQLFLVQQGHFARGGGLLREALLLLFRPVDPNDLVRLAHASHFLDPFLKFAMLVHEDSQCLLIGVFARFRGHDSQ